MEQICQAVQIGRSVVEGIMLHDLLDDPYTHLKSRCPIDTVHRLAEYIGLAMKDRVRGTLCWYLKERPMTVHSALMYCTREFDLSRAKLQRMIDGFIEGDDLTLVCDHLLHPLDVNALRTISQWIKTHCTQPLHPDAWRLRGQGTCPEYRRAFEMVSQHPLSIVTGRAGTGKSHFAVQLMAACRDARQVFRFTAPTGHACLQPMERTVDSFMTIQEATDDHFQCDVLVIDDASLLSAQLFASVLERVPQTCRIVLIGDDHQLPPIGVGYVLRDLLEFTRDHSEQTAVPAVPAVPVVPAVHFTTQHRQTGDLQKFTESLFVDGTRDPESIQKLVDSVRRRVRLIPVASWDGTINALPYASGWGDRGVDTSDWSESSHTSDDSDDSDTTDFSRESEADKENCDPNYPNCPYRRDAHVETDPEVRKGIVLVPRREERDEVNCAIQLYRNALSRCDMGLKIACDGAPQGSLGYVSLDTSNPMDTRIEVRTQDGFKFRASLNAAMSLVTPHRTGAALKPLPYDPIMMTKQTDWCLGEMGVYIGEHRVSVHDPPLGITFHFQNGGSVFTGPDRHEFMLAYSTTVHKSQGGEFACVTVPLVRVHTWSHEMLYTAFTRSKESLVIVGTAEDISMILDNPVPQQPPYLKSILNYL